jgi:hypothetical protein
MNQNPDINQNESPLPQSNLRMKVIIIGILILLLSGIGYSSYTYIQNAPMREFDAAVAGVDIEKIADMEADERKTFFETMKTIRDKMSESQKKINDEKNMQRMNEQFKVKFDRFFSSSPEEQRKALDKDIDRMMGMMKGFMSGKGGFGPPGMGGPGFKGGENTARKSNPANGTNVSSNNPAGNNANGSNNSSPNSNNNNSSNSNANGSNNSSPTGNAANSTNSNSPTNGNTTASAKGKGGSSPVERNKRLSDGLDKSTPEMRAQMTEYWVRMNQRIKERGVQMIPFIGGFGGPKPK